MLTFILGLLSLVSAHTPYRLNIQGDVNGLNITLGSNDALTTSNGTNVTFWIALEEGEEYGTYLIGTGSQLTSDDGFIVATEENGFEPGSFNITSDGLLTLNNSTKFWVCPNDNGDIAFGGSSAPCGGGIAVEIKATLEDVDEAMAEYENLLAAASTSTSTATGTANSSSSSSTKASASSSVSSNAAIALVPAALFVGFSLLI